MVLSSCRDELDNQLSEALNHMEKTKEPVALIIQKDTFENYVLQNNSITDFPMTRETAIQTVVDSICEQSIAVSTTGMISRELFEYREFLQQGHKRDFLTVGSMGHASQIALGIALQTNDRRVYCFDGDGAVIMHLGSLATIGSMKPTTFFHLVFNNGAHDSVGGQPTVGLRIDLPAIALSCGYVFAASVQEKQALKEILQETSKLTGPVLIEIKVSKGARKELGRPTTTPVQNKLDFMQFLSK
jgi:phosphonopyruvate decarboxylase